MSTTKHGRGRPPKAKASRPAGWRSPLSRAVESILAGSPEKVSRAELARRCGWSSQNLYRILSCEVSNIQVSSLARLAKELRVGMDWLLARVAEFERADAKKGGAK